MRNDGERAGPWVRASASSTYGLGQRHGVISPVGFVGVRVSLTLAVISERTETIASAN